MTAPLELEVILSEFSEDAEAWVLQYRTSGKFVIIPDSRFPGRKPIRFFMRHEDAEVLLQELIETMLMLSWFTARMKYSSMFVIVNSF
jgi:hypothetical protein